jgi:hypothetical protein
MHHTASQLIKGNGGNILVVTILILFGVSVIGTTLAMISSTDLKISGNQRTNTTALYVAEAGLSEVLHRISLDDPTEVTVGGWTGNAAIRDPNDPLDPNWEVRVYLTSPGSAPAGNGSVVTTGTLQDPGNPYMQYSAASGTDGVLTVRHKWEDLNGNGAREAGEIVLYDPNAIPNENLATGTPIEVVTVTGVQGQANRAIEAEVFRGSAPGGTSNAMAAVYGNSQVQCYYNYGFCGFNHDFNTAVGTVPMACFAEHLADGHLPGVSNTGGNQIQIYAPGRIEGFPTPTDDSPKPFLTCREILGLSLAEWNDLKSNPDHTSMSSTMNGICIINGDVDLQSNVTGEGLLWIAKKLSINAGVKFRWKGLVYVGEGGDPIDVKDGSEVWVLGSMVAGGEITWKGNDMNDEGVLYCAEAIWRIVGGGTSSNGTATVLSWREL